MELTAKELWTVIHGLILGAIYLLAFTGGLADLWSLKPALLTGKGLHTHLRRLRIGVWLMALISWLTVITGTYLIYPWYHEGPREFLMSNEKLAGWDTFGMEWKIHVGWLSPILMTCVGFIVTYYRIELVHRPALRHILLALFLLSFFTAAIAAIFGTFITKIAPINLGEYTWNLKKLIVPHL